MPNKKRRERMSKLHRVRMGRYRLTRKDILIIEKILRLYANAYELRGAEGLNSSRKVSSRRKVVPRSLADMHVVFGDMRADSVKFLPKSNRNKYYLSFEIRCDPGMWVKFTPFSTVVGIQVLYATGSELRTMQDVESKLISFIKSRPKSLMNVCKPTK